MVYIILSFHSLIKIPDQRPNQNVLYHKDSLIINISLLDSTFSISYIHSLSKPHPFIFVIHSEPCAFSWLLPNLKQAQSSYAQTLETLPAWPLCSLLWHPCTVPSTVSDVRHSTLPLLRVLQCLGSLRCFSTSNPSSGPDTSNLC